MGILEIGVNIGNQNLLVVKFYSQEDLHKDGMLRSFSALRHDFIVAINDLAKNVFGEDLNAITLSEYRLIYTSENVENPYIQEKVPLICYAISDNGSKSNDGTEYTKKILFEVLKHFLSRYSLYTICSPGEVDFQKFEPRIHHIVGDSRFKIEETFKDIFRE
jgi:hypothetical protein